MRKWFKWMLGATIVLWAAYLILCVIGHYTTSVPPGVADFLRWIMPG